MTKDDMIRLAHEVRVLKGGNTMTDTDIHSCGYYCDRPLCIKAQRDELREKMYLKKEWVGLTDEERVQCELNAKNNYFEFARAIEAKLKEKNNG